MLNVEIISMIEFIEYAIFLHFKFHEEVLIFSENECCFGAN